MNSFKPDWFFHAANVLFLAAYSVRDVLWLRLLAVAGSLIVLHYYFLQPHTLWTPIIWCAVFVAINLLRSWGLVLERRPVQLNADEEKVRRLVFEKLPRRKVLQVLNIGSWITADKGAKLIERGTIPETISLIVQGRVRATRDDGRVLGELIEGDLVGSALILTGVPANVDAVTIEPLRAVQWQVQTLDKYLAANPDTRAAMQRHLSRDLAEKVDQLSAI